MESLEYRDEARKKFFLQIFGNVLVYIILSIYVYVVEKGTMEVVKEMASFISRIEQFKQSFDPVLSSDYEYLFFFFLNSILFAYLKHIRILLSLFCINLSLNLCNN